MTQSTTPVAATATHPLVYVAFELRVPFAPRLASQESIEELSRRIDGMPVIREEHRPQFSPGEDGSFDVVPARVWRLFDHEATRSLSITPTSISYETTRYRGFEFLRNHLAEVLEAITQVSPPVGFDRLGLRYVNEIRPSENYASFPDWARAIAADYVKAITGAEDAVRSSFPATGAPVDWPSVADAEDAFDMPDESPSRIVSAESVLKFSLPSSAGMTVRLANLDGTGIVGNAPLRRYQNPEPGPFFLVDFDGYWPLQNGPVRPFDVSEILGLCDHVHSPVKSTFKWATRPTYREESGVVN